MGFLGKILALSLVLTLVFATAAFADTVTNLLDDSPAGTQFEQITLNEGQTRSVSYRVIAVNNDGDTGCNIDANEQLVVDSTSDATAVATANPATATLTFTGCGPNSSGVGVPPPSSTFDRTLQIVGKSRGTANIVLKQASGSNSNTTGSGTYDYNASGIQVIVNNVAPTANNDSYTTSEDNPLTVAAAGVLGNDTDPGTSALTSTLVGPPSNGTVTLNANGSFVYTPNANFNGTDSFTYRANDGQASSGLATVTINVSAVNDRPNAAADTATTGEDQTTQIPVLANDSDPDGDTLRLTGNSQPANGSVNCTPAGVCTYNPNPNFNGEDTFTYTVSDGNGGTATARVSISVGAANDAPVAQNNAYTVAEDTALNVAAPGVLGNDSDVDGDPLSARLVRATGNGTVTLNANGSFVYTPNANFNGSDAFTYTVSDGNGGTATGTVNLTVRPVNDAPVAQNNAYTVAEDGTLTVNSPGVLGNDTDLESNQLRALLVQGPSNGTLNLNASGAFVYTPRADFNGTDTFTYRANDDLADSNVATVTITVTGVNDAPVNTVPAGQATAEDTALVFSAANANRITVADQDAGSGSVQVTLSVGSGTLTLGSTTGVTVTGNGRSTVTVTGTVTNINDALNGLRFDPAANANGAVALTVTTDDQGNSGSGGARTDTDDVQISVTAVNDPPVAQNDTATTNEDTPVVVDVRANDSPGPNEGGQTLTVTTITQAPARGTATIIQSGADAGSVRFTPNADSFGTDTFTYRVCDSGSPQQCATATVEVTVAAVNDPPVAQNDAKTVAEDGALFFPASDLTANDSPGPNEGDRT